MPAPRAVLESWPVQEHQPVRDLLSHQSLLPAELDDAPPLAALSRAAYARGHAAFEQRSTQRALIADWLVERLDRRTGPLSVLSVGCGDGDLDAAVARRLAAGRAGALRYDGLDPHAASAGRFLAAVGGIDDVVSGARVARADSVPAEPAYDVVVAVHCLYYVADLEQVVRRLLGAVRPGGELLVLLAPVGPLNALAAHLAPSTGGHRQWWSQDLAGALTETGLHADRVELHGRLRLDDCLDADDPVGRDVLDFTVQGVLPAGLREPVLDHLIAVRLPGQGLTLSHPVDAWSVRP